jgi:uncharacterized protein
MPSMRIQMMEIRRGLDRADLSASPSDLHLLADWFRRDVALVAKITQLPGGWALGMTIRTLVHRSCDRCLGEVELPVEIEDRCVVLEHGSGVADEEEDRLILVAPEQEWVELDQVVRDALRLSQPEYFVCREDCAGLCPQCGSNMNEGDCGCRPLAPDSPLQALARLKRPNRSQ